MLTAETSRLYLGDISARSGLRRVVIHSVVGGGQQLLEGASFCGNCGRAATPSTRAQAPAPTQHELRVTVPDGCSAGQTIHVQAPDGRILAIVLPPGSAPGMRLAIKL